MDEEYDYCEQCGQEFIITGMGVAHHVDENGEIDNDMDADHVAYSNDCDL